MTDFLRGAPLDDFALDRGEETPFLRPAHRVRPRRARRSPAMRLLQLVQWTGLLVLVVGGGWLSWHRVMRSERLKVSRVDVRGGRFLSDGEVRALLGPAVGQNILTIDIAAVKERLRASPWVADASVERTLPDLLRVEVKERVPLALAEADRLHLMDEDGELIELFGPRTASFDLPIVRHLGHLAPDDRRARARRAGALLADVGELSHAISEVEVEDGGDLRVVLKARDGKSDVVLLGDPPYKERLLGFLGLRADLRARAPKAEAFDLRYRDHVFVRVPDEPGPRPAAPRPTAAPVRPAAAPPAVTGEPREKQPLPPPEPAAAVPPDAAADPSTAEGR